MRINLTNPTLARAAAVFVSTESARCYLNGINFQRAPQGGLYVVSTDGHRMSVGYDPDGTIELDSGESVIVRFPRDILKDLKASNRDGQALALTIDDKTATVATTSEDGGPVIVVAMSPIDIIDATYPDWGRVVPRVDESDDSKAGGAGFNVSYIADIKTIATALGCGKRGCAVSIFGADPTSPHIVRLSGDEAVNWFGVLMPLRIGESAFELPEWYTGNGKIIDSEPVESESVARFMPGPMAIMRPRQAVAA